MPNPFYTATLAPTTGSALASSVIRAEFASIESGFSAIDDDFSANDDALALKAPLASPALTGTPTAPTAADGTNSTQVATTAFVVNTAFSEVLPGQPGHAGNFLLTDGSAASWSAAAWPDLIRQARTSNTMLTASDRGNLIDITSGTFTQTFTAAATLGAGWWCWYHNSGTGTITFDPNGSETIDGVTSGALKPGMSVMIVCSGTGFTAQRIGPLTTTEILTSGVAWVCPVGVRSIRVRAVGGGGGGGGSLISTAGRYGGGGGGYCERFEIVIPGTTYTYAIGAAGAGGSGEGNTNGMDGGSTTWTNGTTITAGGGLGGTTDYAAVTSGSATCSGGIAAPGENGYGERLGTFYASGAGGMSAYGHGFGGKFAYSGTTSGSASWFTPTGYGAGGAGPGYRGASSSVDGQSGTSGVIILEY